MKESIKVLLREGRKLICRKAKIKCNSEAQKKNSTY